ncbi:MAG: GTP-binding protein [Proteobacteria bacterium]|nr:GTP-binding protein [Pseudomonadota bacterium]
MLVANKKDTEILKFTTVGSVDDGKSTLIGRLLFDSKAIFEDQLESVQKTSAKKGFNGIDLSLLTDGLAAEREQGITIDVAYRYFATPKRKFIIADTPGHVQYTRNMVTGASTANLTIILVDARNGILDQSRRHAYISALLGIPYFIVAVNKMDLVDYSEAKFNEIVSSFDEMMTSIGIKPSQIFYIPVSALAGDNVVNRGEQLHDKTAVERASSRLRRTNDRSVLEVHEDHEDNENAEIGVRQQSYNMPWYKGATIMEVLESVNPNTVQSFNKFRMPVQIVIRNDSPEYRDFRGFAGKVTCGEIKVGDEIISLPSKKKSRVKSIHLYEAKLDRAYAGQSVTICLEDEIDTSRGDMFVKAGEEPALEAQFSADLCWMSEDPFQLGKKYYLKHCSSLVKAMPTKIEYKLDINNFSKHPAETLSLNDIARVEFKLLKAIPVDKYDESRSTGSFILIDEITNNTVAAGMIR